jgi:hypothetical protein
MQCCLTRMGSLCALTPMKDGNGKEDKDVAVYPGILIESDEDSLEAQWAAIQKIGLPIRSAVFSGDRSVNTVITIDAPDEASYRPCDHVIADPNLPHSGSQDRLPKFVKVPGELEAKLAAMANGASGVDLGLLE